MRLVFYRDDRGYARARSDDYPLLAGFLESDVQGSGESCRYYLTALENVRNGVESTYSVTGNAYTITATPATAVIEAEWEIPQTSCELPLDDLIEALNRWLMFVDAAG